MPKEKDEIRRVMNVGSLELTEEIIRTRAYQLFEQRGCEQGRDLDDWLQAEAEIVGKKLAPSADAPSKPLHKVTAA